jgi:hypothetical protein
MSGDPLTVEDFISCEWQKAISLATDKTINHYSSAFGATTELDISEHIRCSQEAVRGKPFGKQSTCFVVICRRSLNPT